MNSLAMSKLTNPYGVLAEFRTAASVLHAAEKVRDMGFRKWDVFTPFPVHGMDKAMGLKNSKVGWFAFIGGVTGYATGMLMIWFMNTLDYPIVIGGKPMFSPYAASAWGFTRIRIDCRWPPPMLTSPTPGNCEIFCASRVSARSSTAVSGNVFEVSASVRIGASAGLTLA